MLATSPIINSRYPLFSTKPYSNPLHHRIHQIVVCRCSSSRSSLSLRQERFHSDALVLLDGAQQDEEDPGLEEKKKKKKSSRFLASTVSDLIKLRTHYAGGTSVVTLFCTRTPPDYFCPFQRGKLTTSSGFIVRGRKVLTCAHSVDQHTKVQLKKHNSDTLYTATVLAVALECDLAILTVNDDKFWEGVIPVEFGYVPAPGDKLAFMGYPSGKFSMITTTVSRVSMVKISLSQAEQLCVRVDVDLGPGSSGGPVFNKIGKCVGMQFQSHSGSDLIAAPVIGHVLQDYDKNGAYTGFPTLPIVWQNMENPDLRSFMKMEHGQQGVLIIEVKPNYPEYEILKPNDIILSIDGFNIFNDGTVLFNLEQRILFSYLFTRKYTGDTVHIKVLRNSEMQTYSIKLTTHKQFKPANTSGRPFPYYIIAGFVFTLLSIPYLHSEYGQALENISDEIISQALYEERVVISKVLKSGTRNGYDHMTYLENAQVLAVNGMPVKSLKSFASIIESCNEEFLEFTLDKQKKLVLHTASAKARTPDILKMHNIASPISDDLKNVT